MFGKRNNKSPGASTMRRTASDFYIAPAHVIVDGKDAKNMGEAQKLMGKLDRKARVRVSGRKQVGVTVEASKIKHLEM